MEHQWCCDTETQMLKPGIINIWTCFPLSILAAFEESQIKGQHMRSLWFAHHTNPKDSERSNLKPIQMLSIHPVAILIASKAFGRHIRARKSRGQIRPNVSMLIEEYRKAHPMMAMYKMITDL